MQANVHLMTLYTLLTNYPVHLFEVVTVAAMATFASKGGVIEQRGMHMDQ